MRRLASIQYLLVVILLLPGHAALAAPIITLGPGVKNPPAPLRSIVPELAVADKAQLVTSADFNATLAATLKASGFTAAHDWVYSFDAADLPAGIVNPVPLPANANFNITAYNLYLDPPKREFGELMKFTLVNPAADPVLAGATISSHWLQLLHTDRRYNGSGFPIADLPGFWRLDNGGVVLEEDMDVEGLGPFYDSNAPAGKFSVPPTFSDSPEFYEGVGTYLHFTTILSWDVSIGGKDYLIVGDTGITWGFVIVPEPPAIILVCLGILLITVVVRFQRTGSA